MVCVSIKIAESIKIVLCYQYCLKRDSATGNSENNV